VNLVCDNGQCRVASRCPGPGLAGVAIECLSHQACVDGGPDADSSCLDMCDPGFVWDGVACAEQVAPQTCLNDPSDPNARGDDCAAGEHRACAIVDAAAVCSDCLPDWVPLEGACVPRVTCAELACNGRYNRDCVFGDANTHETCGGCKTGYLPEAMDCGRDICPCVANGAASCDPAAPGADYIGDDCEAAHRPCVPPSADRPAAYCGESCEQRPGASFIWNPARQVCEPRVTCETAESVGCDALRRECDGADLSRHAACTACAPGYASPDGGRQCAPIVACGPDSCPAGRSCRVIDGQIDCTGVEVCDRRTQVEVAGGGCIDGCAPCPAAAGLTGLLASGENPGCLCESQPGFAINENNLPVNCDKDGDLFMNVEAYSRLHFGEGQADARAATVRREARCVEHRIREFRLIPESDPVHATRDVPISSLVPNRDFVPLVETSRNDREDRLANERQDAPNYPGGHEFDPRELNPLVKFCASPSADYNDNGVPDVRDIGLPGQEHGLPLEVAAAYFQMSFFAETHTMTFDNWDAPSQIIVRERPRLDGGADSVPFSGDGGSEFWRQCLRRRDSLADDPDLASTTPGLDFATFVEPQGHTGMTHHSQFKCLVATPPGDVRLRGDTEAPPYVDLNELETRYIPQTCSVVPNRAGAFECSPAVGPVGADTALWGIVRHIDYGNDATVVCRDPVTGRDDSSVCGGMECRDGLCVDPNLGGEYVRGCVNECEELRLGNFALGDPAACGVGVGVSGDETGYIAATCPQFDVCTGFADARFACQGLALQYGRLACGCGLNYTGERCEASCPDSELVYSAGFNIATREGVWMCASIAGSEGKTMDSGGNGGIVLEGAVPLSAVDRSLESVSPGCADNDPATPCIRLQ
jgi:hypothetical protein